MYVSPYVCCDETCFNLHAAPPPPSVCCHSDTLWLTQTVMAVLHTPWYYYVWPATVHDLSNTQSYIRPRYYYSCCNSKGIIFRCLLVAGWVFHCLSVCWYAVCWCLSFFIALCYLHVALKYILALRQLRSSFFLLYVRRTKIFTRWIRPKWRFEVVINIWSLQDIHLILQRFSNSPRPQCDISNTGRQESTVQQYSVATQTIIQYEHTNFELWTLLTAVELVRILVELRTSTHRFTTYVITTTHCKDFNSRLELTDFISFNFFKQLFSFHTLSAILQFSPCRIDAHAVWGVVGGSTYRLLLLHLWYGECTHTHTHTHTP